MAINLRFDLMNNPEPPSIVLANRNGNKIGQLNVDAQSIDVKDLLKTSEFSFTLNKYIDDEPVPYWDKVVDFKLVYCPEWDLWYEITVELDEATETVKTVFCTQLGQSELSQIKVYNIEINTEEDIARDDYKISILYDEDNKDASILHRVMSRAPHYSIAYIDESLQRIQRSFSFDDASICDVFDEIEEEVGCLVVYNSNSDENGMPKRDVSIYDLLQNCNSCGHRGEFTDKCPKCGGTDIDYGYGEDTAIFVTADELASEGIQLVTDTDSVKNCFKLEAGDDLMTATIRNCNPNGSDYIWYFSDAVKEDMSKELVEAIEAYDTKYKEYYDTYVSELDTSLVNEYNALVEKYKEYYNTPSTCINCDYEGEFENECPSCHSTNILIGKSLQAINTPITGYSALMNAYYNTIDLALYLESGLMPNVEMSDTSAEEQVELLTATSLSPVAVNVENVNNVSLATANSAVLSMTKVIVKPTYKVEIGTSTLSDDKIWSGQFIITNYSDETDTATSDTVSVVINNEIEDFIKQKIEKALKKENTDDLSISGLFDEDKYDYDAFCNELKKYALNPLKSFYDACDACLNILTEQGAGDENQKDLYENLYEPYYERSQAIANEIKIREDEIAVIEGVYDETNEDNKVLIVEGLQTKIEDCRKEIQDALNFEEYLGENLWLELCAYRREDKYSNSNYVSDGLNNAELFEKALEFIEVAEEEIFKSAELQHSISATLNNLLSLPKFKPLLKSFKTGNWIRVQVDDRIFKLRMLEYNFNYGDLESIPVEFSDVTKIKNGTTDVQDVFSQAASIASSYDSVQRQAKKGNVARSTIDQWLVDGLNAANVQIQSNDNEEVLLTKNGLLARSYSDITGTYSPEQFKLTHNIMAYTTDDWKTVSTALGKHDYKYWNGAQFVDDEDYGLSTKFVTAGYVTGSQIIGGEIVSSNYKSGTSGTYFNLINGDFEIAGGNIVYQIDENNESTLTLKNVTIEWDSTTKPEVKDVTGLEEYLEQLEDLEDLIDGRIQTYSQSEDPSLSWTDAEKANHIGDLWLNPDNGLMKRWTGTEWVVVTDSELAELVQAKAQIFTTTPTPPYYVGDLWVQGSTGDILHCVNDRESGTYVESDWVKSSKYTDDTSLNTFISGEYADDLKDISEQIDKKAETWYQSEDPSASWTTDELKSLHVGDLWFNTTENKNYIYDASYTWVEANGVPDEVYDAIDGKAQIFTTTPTPPYYVGDLWVQGSNGEIMRCMTERTTGSYASSDWEKASKYTDNARADEAYGLADEAKGIADNAKDIGDKLVNGLGFEETEITGQYVISPVIAGGTLLIGDATGTYAQITTDGVLNCVGANINGKVVATAGQIGGCEIADGTLKIKNVNIGEKLTADQIDATNLQVSAANITGTLTANQIDATNLQVNAANVTGTLTSDQIDATGAVIGGWTIRDDDLMTSVGSYVYLSGKGDYTATESSAIGTAVSNLVFRVGSSGANAVFGIGSDGAMYATSGKIGGWTIDKSALTSSSSLSHNISLRPGSGFWYQHTTPPTDSSSTDITIVGNTISFNQLDSFQPVNTEYDFSGMAIRHLNYSGLSKSISEAAYDLVRIGGTTTTFGSGASAVPVSDVSVVELCTKYGFLSHTGKPSDGTDGILNITSHGKINLISKEGTLQGTWSGTSAVSTTSDATRKNSIEVMTDDYELLFDNLKPKRFKYNDGTSDRYHTGFIAQDVKNAIDAADLSTQDFAAYVTLHQGEEDEHNGLRYEEFVSLNTWQIQKLKAKVAELEARLNLLTQSNE